MATCKPDAYKTCSWSVERVFLRRAAIKLKSVARRIFLNAWLTANLMLAKILIAKQLSGKTHCIERKAESFDRWPNKLAACKLMTYS